MQSLIIMAAIVAASGNLIDHILNKKQNIEIEQFIRAIHNQLIDSSFPNIFKLLTEKTLLFFEHIIGSDKFSVKKICIIVLISFFITLLSISIAHLISIKHSMIDRVVSLLIVIISIYIICFIAKNGYNNINKYHLLKFFIILNLLTLALQPVALSFFRFRSEIANIDNVTIITHYYYSCWIYGIVNCFFDILTIVATLHILSIIKEKRHGFEISMFICIDVVVAFVLAGLSAFCLLISFYYLDGHIYYQYKEINQTINLFHIYECLYTSYSTLNFSNNRLDSVLAIYAGTAFIPTFIYLFFLLISYYVKISLTIVHLVSVYILRSRIEDNNANFFSILGSFFSVIFLLIALIKSLQ